jgi:hypothetical protein
MAAVTHQGSILKCGSPLTVVNGVTDLAGPALGLTTFLESTAINDSAKQFRADPLTDYGEVTFDLYYNFADAQHVILKAAAVGKTVVAFSELIGSPQDCSAAYSGYVSMGELKNKNGMVAVPVTVKLTGVATIAA